MGFSMLVYVDARPYLFLLITLCLSPAILASSANIIATNIHQANHEQPFSINAQLHYSLSPAVTDAVHNGVPIPFIHHATIKEWVPLIGQWLNWRTITWQQRQYCQLRYHALVKQYIVSSENTHYSFSHLSEALQALGKIRFATPHHHYNSQASQLWLRSTIDYSALPTSLRLATLFSADWQMNAPWKHIAWPH